MSSTARTCGDWPLQAPFFDVRVEDGRWEAGWWCGGEGGGDVGGEEAEESGLLEGGERGRCFGWRQVVSQVGEGWRDFVVVMWVDSWVRMVEGWDAMVVRQIMTFGDDDSSVCDGCVVLRRSRCRHGK
jgi:hypothetical protein